MVEQARNKEQSVQLTQGQQRAGIAQYDSRGLQPSCPYQKFTSI